MPYVNKEKAQEYNHKYHLKTWLKRKNKHNENKRKRRISLAKWLEKEGTVANMISEGYSKKNIIQEIDKCIVLCKNCYAKVHYLHKFMKVSK